MPSVHASTRPCVNNSKYNGKGKHSHIVLIADAGTNLSSIDGVDSPVEDTGSLYSWAARFVKGESNYVVIGLKTTKGVLTRTRRRRVGLLGLDTANLDITLTDSSDPTGGSNIPVTVTVDIVTDAVG